MALLNSQDIRGNLDKLIVLGGLIVIFICGMYQLSIHYSICILDDEFAYWGMGAQMSGLDWRQLLATTSFYSYGYGFLLVPLFWTGMSATTMYQTAIIINIGLVMLSYALTVWVAGKVFPEIDKKILAVVALVVTLYSNNIVQMHIAWGECLLYCLFWCVVALVCRIVEKHKLLDYILLAVVAVFLYAVHNRSLGVLMLVAFLLVLFYLFSLFKKKPEHKILLGMGCMVLLFFLVSLLRQYTIDHWYANNSIIPINDYSGNVSRVSGLFNLSGLWNFITSFMGKTFAQATATFLLILPPFIVTVGFVLKNLFLRLFRRQKVAWSLRNWLFFVGSGGYLLELLISAFYKSDPTVTAHNFFYSRYSDFAIGPLMLFGACLFLEKRKYWGSLLAGLLIYLLCGAVSLLQIQKATDMTLNNFHAVGIYHFFADLDSPSQAVIRMFIAGLVGFFVMVGGKFLAVKKPHKVTFLVLLVSICIAGGYWCSMGIGTVDEWLRLNWNKGQRIVVRIEKELEKLPEDTEIYYIIGGSANHARNAMMHLKTLQSLEPRRVIRLVSVDDLQPAYEGNYVYMSGANEELMRVIISRGKQFVYNSGAQCIYAEVGSEAVELLQ